VSSFDFQRGATAVGDGNVVDVSASEIGVQVTISGVATVAFEGSIDGVTFFALEAVPSGGGASVTTATASGLFRVLAPFSKVRARVSAFTSGSVDALASVPG